MFCNHCGSEIDDDTIYCSFCGKKVEKAEVASADETIVYEEPAEETWFVNEQYEKEKNWEEQPAFPKRDIRKPAIIAAACVLVAVGLGIGAYFVFGSSSGDEVDLKELVNGPVATGYDGLGEMEADLRVDEQKMDAYLGTIKDEQRRSAVKGVLLTVVYHPDTCEKLSNGDVVTINAEYDKTMAADIELKVTNESFGYVVEGLAAGEDIAYDPEKCHSYPNDFVFSESDIRTYDEDVLYGTVGEDEDLIQRAINEIYARHGVIFDDSYYKKYYEKCSWYTPVYTDDQFKSAWFNQHENTNLKNLTDYRKLIRDIHADETKTVTCEICGKKMMKKEAIEDYGSYFCNDCYYDSPDEQEDYNDDYDEDEYEDYDGNYENFEEYDVDN